MHELSLSQAVLDTALRHADGRAVTAVTVRVGALRQVVPDSLEFYFELVSRDTLCDGATLEVEPMPAVLRCTGCSLEWRLESTLFACPACGGRDVGVVAGNELEVESIIVEEEEACIAPR